MAGRSIALRFRDWPVRLKLVALLVAASVVPVGLATAVDIRMAHAKWRAGIAALLAARSDQLRGELDVFHAGYLRSATMLARLPASIAVAEAAAAGAAPDPAVLRSVFERHVATDTQLRAIALLDGVGRVIAASDPSLTGRVLGERDFVQQALRGAPVISDVESLDAALDPTPAVAYAAPVRGAAGPVGLVVVWLRAQVMWKLVRGSNALAGPGSFAVVFDNHGIRIAHTYSAEIVFHPAGALDPELIDALDRERRFGPDTRRLLGDVRAFPEQFERARATTPDRELFCGLAPVNGELNYGVARRLATVPWTVFYMVPEVEVNTEIAAITRDKVLLAGLITAVAFAVGLLLTVIILRPVVALSAATSKISAGDLSARVALADGGDELGRLCASFNAMTERIERDATELRRSRDQLERRVEERTAALEATTARLEVLSRIGHELAIASGDAETVLELAARRMGELIGDACAIRLVSDDGAWLENAVTFSRSDPDRSELIRRVLSTSRAPVGDGTIGGLVAASGKAMLLAEITPERLRELEKGVPAFAALAERLGLSSALTLPVRSRDRTVGVVTLTRTDPNHPYTLEDQQFGQDIADRAGLAIDNAVLVATLERRVAARTAALEQANLELEAFSYSVSHDLRAPLRAIDGFSQVLLAEHSARLDDDGRHYLERVRSATQRMATLIDDLLGLAQITRTRLRWQLVDLTGAAEHVAGELRRRDPGRTTPIHIAPHLVSHGDARLMSIVFDNLLGNAWKFTAKHDAAEIWFGAEDRDGTVVFFVRDSGAGFDMQYIDKLFGAFQRLHSANEYDGVGIGLATVHRIITRHGGKIWAEAAVDRGATFYFTLGRDMASSDHGRR